MHVPAEEQGCAGASWEGRECTGLCFCSPSKTAFNPREHINTGFVNRDVWVVILGYISLWIMLYIFDVTGTMGLAPKEVCSSRDKLHLCSQESKRCCSG